MRQIVFGVVTVVLVGLLPVTLTASDGTGGIQGTITDGETGDPLPFVNVIVPGSTAGGATDTYGHYSIQRLMEGEYEVVATMMGYGKVAKRVEVRVGEVAVVDFQLVVSPIEMGEVVVTGTKTPRYVKEVPVRTEVITRKKIEDKAACNLYEALEGEPGVHIEQACQACNFSTVRLQGLGPDHTQILLDGQPIYTGLASIYGLQQIGTSAIERMEIVKGAGSALYGSQAVAGAINLITAKPGPRPETGVLFQYGSHGTSRLELSASSRVDNVGFVIFGQMASGDPIDETGDGLSRSEVMNPDGVSDRVMTETTNLGFNVAVDNLGVDDRLTVRGRSVREIRRGGVVDQDLFKNPFTLGTERILTNRYVLDGVYEKTLAGGSDMSITAAYAHHERDATNDTFHGDYLDANGEPPPIDLLRPYIADEDVYTLNLDYGRFFGRHHLLAGLQYTHNRLEESGMYVVVDEEDPSYGDFYTSLSDKHANDVGVYLQDEYVAGDDLEIVAGVRLDIHESEDSFSGTGDAAPGEVDPITYDETSVNPRLAVRYRIGPSLYLRGSFGTGFRVPYGFSEDLHLCSGSPRIWKGPELEPENSRSFTLSVDWEGDGLQGGANLYRTDLTNKIGFVDASEEASRRGYTYEWKNIDDAWVQGIELYVGWQPRAWLDLDASLTLNNGEYAGRREDWVGTPYEEDSKYISRFPAYTAGLDFTISRSGWNIVTGTYLTGPMYIDYYAEGEEPTKIKRTDPFLIVNGKVSRRIFNRVSLFAGAKNLTDYVQPEKHTDDAAFMYAPVYGRMIYGGIEL
jgi:outer membrane receptor for ferrienterochelin and colicins